MRYSNILDIIGNTPIVEIKKANPYSQVKIFAKLEGFNPGGSVKDRIAKYMIEDAEKKGLLTPAKTILEATSGNTGIALAMVAAVRGYKFTAVLPKNTSLEKRNLIQAFGGKVYLTEGNNGTNGAIKIARRWVC